MTLAGREIRERHLVFATNFRIHVVDRTREAVGRKPLGQCSGVQESAIDTFGGRTEDTVKFDGSVGMTDNPFDFRFGKSGDVAGRLVARVFCRWGSAMSPQY